MAHECPSSKRGRHSAQFFARVCSNDGYSELAQHVPNRLRSTMLLSGKPVALPNVQHTVASILK